MGQGDLSQVGPVRADDIEAEIALDAAGVAEEHELVTDRRAPRDKPGWHDAAEVQRPETGPVRQVEQRELGFVRDQDGRELRLVRRHGGSFRVGEEHRRGLSDIRPVRIGPHDRKATRHEPAEPDRAPVLRESLGECPLACDKQASGCPEGIGDVDVTLLVVDDRPVRGRPVERVGLARARPDHGDRDGEGDDQQGKDADRPPRHSADPGRSML